MSSDYHLFTVTFSCYNDWISRLAALSVVGMTSDAFLMGAVDRGHLYSLEEAAEALGPVSPHLRACWINSSR